MSDEDPLLPKTRYKWTVRYVVTVMTVLLIIEVWTLVTQGQLTW